MRPLSFICALCLSTAICTDAWATSFSTIFKFNGDTAENPHGTVFKDRDGALYGTSYFFGPGGHGVVYKLSPPGEGKTKWTYEILHSFSGGADGAYPVGALLREKSGALVGVTYQGGANNAGTIFKLSPSKGGNGQWNETVLYDFTQSESFPSGDLLKDQAGNLYGTVSSGGAQSAGVVFRLRPPVGEEQNWTKDDLYVFDGTSDGHSPNSVLAGDGNALYGTTSSGGASNLGVAFQLVPPESGNGPWTQSVLYDFGGGADGAGPRGGLVLKNGKLFGTTSAGGDKNYGTVFQLAPPKHGGSTWKESVIHSFSGSDGRLPYEALTAGAAGTLYGGTVEGGTGSKVGHGTIFSLTPPGAGQSEWTEQVLHSFDNKNDGNSPDRLWFDKAGTIYGVTQYGMRSNTGSIFELIP